LSKVKKESYFIEKVRYKETIPSHFGTSQNSHPNVFKINSLIVETVIGDMFFHPDDHDGITRTQALKSFIPCSDPNIHDDDSETRSYYTVAIKNPLQFQLIIAYLASGLSFRQAENVLTKTKKLTGNAQLGSISDAIVANFACIVCALNLQKLSDILNDASIWAFSLANDSSTHYGNSYFDS